MPLARVSALCALPTPLCGGHQAVRTTPSPLPTLPLGHQFRVGICFFVGNRFFRSFRLVSGRFRGCHLIAFRLHPFRIRILDTFDPRSSIHYADYSLRPFLAGKFPSPTLLAGKFPSPSPPGLGIPLPQPSWLGNSPPPAVLARKFPSPNLLG